VPGYCNSRAAVSEQLQLQGHVCFTDLGYDLPACRALASPSLWHACQLLLAVRLLCLVRTAPWACMTGWPTTSTSQPQPSPCARYPAV
jgi:hypothetical protein